MNIPEEEKNSTNCQGQKSHNFDRLRRGAKEAGHSNTGSQAEIGNGIARSNGLPEQTGKLTEDPARKENQEPLWTTPQLFCNRAYQRKAHQVKDGPANASVLHEERRDQAPPVACQETCIVPLKGRQDGSDEKLQGGRDRNEKHDHKSEVRCFSFLLCGSCSQK